MKGRTVSSPLFDLRPKYGGDNEDSGNPFEKVLCMHGFVLQTLKQATIDPCLHQRPLDTDKQVWVSLLWGHCSLLLDPGTHMVLFVSFKSLLSQSCVSSGSSMMELMVTSSERAYAIPRSTAPKAPAPAAVHCWPILLQQTLKHNSVLVFVGSLGPGVHKACLSPLSISGGCGVWFWMQFCPSYHLARASPLPLEVFDGIQHSPVNGCWAVRCHFGVLKGKTSARPSILPS